MKYLSPIDASKAGTLTFPTYTLFASFPTASTYPGAMIYAQDTNKVYYSNGTSWIDFSPVAGAMVLRGVVAFNFTEPSSPATGDLYVFSSAGTNIWEGSVVVEIGDSAVWDGSAWKFIQTNTLTSSETIAGVVELATVAEAITGTDTARAVTPQGAKAAHDANRVTSVDAVAGTTLTGNSVKTTFEVIHTGGTDAICVVRENVSGVQVTVDITRTAATTFDIIFAVAPAATPVYKVIVR